eukprot:scaffold361_cov248-Pinguiococcus_pyrenoidosus.AAC.33
MGRTSILRPSDFFRSEAARIPFRERTWAFCVLPRFLRARLLSERDEIGSRLRRAAVRPSAYSHEARSKRTS